MRMNFTWAKQFVKKNPILWETKYNNEILFSRKIGAIYRQHFCCVCFYTLVIFTILTPPKRRKKLYFSRRVFLKSDKNDFLLYLHTFRWTKKMIFHYHNRWQTDGSPMIKPHTNINYVWFGSLCGGWTHRLRRYKIKNSQFINSHVYEREGGSKKKMKRTQMTDRTDCLLQHAKVLQTLNWS